jgi:hypothetical protein
LNHSYGTSPVPLQIKSPRWLMPGLILVSLAGLVLVFFSTPWGIGVGYDSVFYLGSARSLLEGRGLSWPVGTNVYEPLIHYPPLYPLLLAGLGALGINLTAAAGVVAGLLFGANIFLVGLFIARFSRFPWVSIFVALIALGSPILLDVHLMAMTEPLFIWFLLLALIKLSVHLEAGKAGSYWWAAAFTVLASLTRYAGPSLAASAFMTLLIFERGDLIQRMKSGLTFVVVSLLPLLAWYARNIVLSGSASNRELAYHPVSLMKIKGALVTISEWWISHDASSGMKKLALVAIGLLIAGLLVAILRLRILSKGGSEGRRAQLHLYAPTVLILFILTYTMLLLASLTFVDASTRLNDRILSPIYVASLALLGVLSGLVLDPEGKPKPVLAGLVLVSALLFGSYGLRTKELVSEMRTDGRGFTGRDWQASETIALVRGMDIEGVIYSSEPLPFYYLTEQAAYWVPEIIDPLAAREISDYRERLALMRRRLRTPGSYLVLFDKSFRREEMPPVEEVVAGLQLLYRAADGSIWIHPDTSAP